MTDAPTPMSLLIARTVWIMFGPLFLLVCAGKIVTTDDGWLGFTDIAYLAGLAVIILARGFEFYKGDPRTSTGEPATKDDLRRYVLLTILLGIGIWILANLVGNHLG